MLRPPESLVEDVIPCDERREGLSRPPGRDRAIPGPGRLAVHLDDRLHEVDDPVLGDAGDGVDAGLPRPVVLQRAVGHFGWTLTVCPPERPRRSASSATSTAAA
jgi:hypothetical protein